MRRNDKGIAVPGAGQPLPWAMIPDHAGDYIVAANDEEVCDVSRLESTAEFMVHAANYHERLADIVRRLAEWRNAVDTSEDGLFEITRDTAELWEDMRKDGE